MEQQVEFLAPVLFGDTISAIVEVTDIFLEKNRVRLRTYCKNQNDEIVIDGYATVIPPKATKL